MEKNKIICSVLAVFFLSSLSFQDMIVLANEKNTEKVISLTQEQNNENYIFLSYLEYIKSMSNTSWGSIKMDQNISGDKITLNVDGEALQFDKGIGAHATSNLVYDVSNYSQTYSRFTTYVGIDRSQWDKGNGIKVTVSASDDGKE